MFVDQFGIMELPKVLKSGRAVDDVPGFRRAAFFGPLFITATLARAPCTNSGEPDHSVPWRVVWYTSKVPSRLLGQTSSFSWFQVRSARSSSLNLPNRTTIPTDS